ncbi:MAG: hypothetical protein F4058_01960 [Rhodothermaceae bacterium]|nr:hypothetical protein [Rhodothermaceae bacterium]MYF64101.1 hypothetical protein [Rhodothermaceae bacterium]MYI84076.1 hypothetical protein [Rhodothermaceae bacterium]
MKGATRIDVLGVAYDAVIPGFWSWYCKHEFKGRSRTVLSLKERKVILCGFNYAEQYLEHHRYAERWMALEVHEGELMAHAREYAPLFCCTFPDRDLALDELYELRDKNAAFEQERTLVWLYGDDSALAQRCRAMLRALKYIEKNATSIRPVWEQANPKSLLTK